MMWQRLCDGGGGDDGSANLIIMCALACIIILASPVPPSACANATPERKRPAALDDDDLIEGQLDSSRVCGTRYPAVSSAIIEQRKLRALDESQATIGGGGEGGRGGGGDKIDTKYNQLNSNFANRAKLLYIVGGDEVEDDQFWPWSVAIYELDPLNGRRAFICSGSLISDKFILTAAHCIQQSRFDILTPDEIFLKIASVRLDDDRSHFYEIDKAYIHPAYTVERKTNDIALLKLKPGQRLPHRARPICLPSNVANRTDFTDQQVTIIGWGKTSAMQGNEPSRLIDVISAGAGGGGKGGIAQVGNEIGQNLEEEEGEQEQDGQSRLTGENTNYGGGRGEERIGQEAQTNDTLLQAEVRVTSTDQCNRNYSKLEISWLNIDDHFLCASDPQGKRDACQGDSGGPLMWNNQQTSSAWDGGPGGAEKWFQLGLVSFGYGCANRQYPGVYTRISYYMPWILKIVGRKNAGAAGTRQPN